MEWVDDPEAVTPAAPVLANPIDDQNDATKDCSYDYTFPSDTFYDANGDH